MYDIFMIYILLIFDLFSSSLFGSFQGLAYINSLRLDAGLIKLKANKHLAHSAYSHAKYLIYNQQSGHYEKHTYKYFTGKTPALRVLKAGYGSAFVMENLTINTKNQKVSIDNLFSAIYHRFVFLSLDKDEIGLGEYKGQGIYKQAFVYDLGLSSISLLCKKKFPMRNGLMYIKGLCKNPNKMILQAKYKAKIRKIQDKNPNIVLYPYPKQKDISPAFYNESPDPLPSYKVSGFPISVQFNPKKYKKVKLIYFKLYNEAKESKKCKILTSKNDPNHKFLPLEFALMPLERLEYDEEYTVKIKFRGSNKIIKKSWSFHTKSFDIPLHTITKKKSYFTIKKGSSHIFYIKPKNRKDIIQRYKTRGNIKVSIIDANTLKVYAKKISSKAKIIVNKRNIYLNIE